MDVGCDGLYHSVLTWYGKYRRWYWYSTVRCRPCRTVNTVCWILTVSPLATTVQPRVGNFSPSLAPKFKFQIPWSSITKVSPQKQHHLSIVPLTHHYWSDLDCCCCPFNSLFLILFSFHHYIRVTCLFSIGWLISMTPLVFPICQLLFLLDSLFY